MVAERLATVEARVAAAARRSGRDPHEITLVAVTKSHPTGVIEAAYEAGHRDFGENRAAEMADKAARLPGDIRWHFIGSLQRRKAKLIRPVTHLLHSIDRDALAETWARSDDPVPPVLIQINIGREPQKGGVLAENAPSLLETCLGLGLDVRGVMAIPPAPEQPDDSRRWFGGLVELHGALHAIHPGMREVSIGMTDDFEVAIEAGSTMIRVGRAIFGPRPTG
jgi:pyridoxal phosphate enzyme (YggS family)